MALFSSVASADEMSQLETIVVTASKHETSLQLAPASISVIDSEELKLRDADDLADALTAQAGVTVTSVGQNRRGISMRGMPVEHTLYLVDGRRISSSNSVMAHTDFELSWLPSSAIERIEVVRGPMSSLYGADALGGVVNIITRTPGGDFHGEVSTTATTIPGVNGGDTNKTALYLGGALIEDKLHFSLGGELYDRDNLPNKDNENASDIESRESLQGEGKLIWTIDENQELMLSYASGNDDRDRDVSSRGKNYVSKDEIERMQTSLSYQGDWDWGHVKLNAYQSNIVRKNSRSHEDEPRSPQKVRDSVIDGHVGMELGEQHLVTLGGQFRNEKLNEARLTHTGEATADHTSVFVQDEWQLVESLLLVGGVSVDNHEKFGSEVSPRVYAVYSLSDSITFKGGYGEGFRAPSLTELSPDYQVFAGGNRFWVEGNQYLEPERTETYEAGVEYHQSNWVVSTRVFENQLENLVQSVCYTDCGVRGSERRRYENVDESRIRGLEFAFTHDLTDQVNIDLNYTFLDTEDLGSNDPLEDRPEYNANIALSWSPIEAIDLRWRSEYIGKQYVGTHAGTEDYSPEYNLHHVDFSYEINDYFTVYSGVENIFDEHLAEESDLYNTTEPGRSFRLGVTVSF
ncbi:MAG: TonB-dependent receptor [Alteromonadales bacterium]|nr:TonB-dependent receptor [Alteromonadales bacterium]